ncbi:FAD/NAD(P)-binding oxidoreductase [Pyrococcus furiosus DSM 3638]|uniref:FAD/NAD(P)-binding oxidoreductase n=3 Tax=Pyrococcus furiosus TaxID=2261 RepID=A0A5C0XS34_PYRFU|nr:MULTISPECIES: NAD(P)/FAD-dependent oxidoreductase [Pyrococcus]AAL82129.1 glycerol-3-phosphate dehydrogenase [Pyrococcus furiosus DSM 3638]AFN04637.1 glycerol-3-phosphate dehydrogenase [Pyrococcus furiosus COM1]MDK2869589.1 glycerol-3-phosphate dehydrogenase [Pyrococcus sp.]QEK79599.1 FAD/NAD(P)-binding oxidoreductase [Pyrococcus furiosus DSM 3638]
MIKVAIIGAGITGASIARVLSRYENLEVHLIDKNPDVGWGVSKANTALIHGGYDDDPDKYPMRAKLCVRGNRLWHRWVKELEIPHIWNGALVVALEEEDFDELEKLLERGIRNGVPEMRIVDREELFHLEPGLNPEAKGALWIPTVGQIGPIPAVIAIVENAVANGVKIHLNTKVKGIKVQNGEVKGVETNNGFIEADVIINAAGLYADEISRMVGLDYFTIHPRKGEYWIFDDTVPGPRRVLFPTPTPISKGIVVTTEISGHLMIGPNAQDLPPEEKENLATTREGLEEVWEGAKKLWPNLPPRSKVIRTFAGLRPEPTGGDFIIKAEEEVFGFINVAGIRSPGLTSAPAIAYEVAEIIQRDLGIKLIEKEKWNPYRKDITRFSMLSPEEANRLIRENPAYGKIVCRCNLVTEGEILEAIERMKFIGVKIPSIDSIKFRTKATSGTCQGSFCRVRIIQLLSKAYNVPPWEITLKGEGSEIGIGDVKALLRGENSA